VRSLLPFNLPISSSCLTFGPADLCDISPLFIPAMAAALPRVMRVPRTDLKDGQDHFVLVHVESAGKQALDLKLVGTDGESVFSVSGKLAS